MKSLLFVALGMFCWGSTSAQAYPDRHSTTWKDAWVSCETSDSPNVKRDPGHWIMYDLGDQYSLHESTFWNNNVPGQTARGLNQIIVDYSIDGAEWVELGTYNLSQGPGSAFYQVDDGPDFNGVNARYALISGMSNYGDNCFSLSEVRINAAISTTTSFADNELDVKMIVSPNPAANIARITLNEMPAGNVQYQLTGVDGKLYMKGEVSNTEFEINVSQLSTGSYTFILFNEKGIKSQIVNVISE